MDRKTLDKAILRDTIEVYRDIYIRDADVYKTWEAFREKHSIDKSILWLWVRDIVHGVIAGMKRNATDEDIFKIFQSLGYDIV